MNCGTLVTTIMPAKLSSGHKGLRFSRLTTFLDCLFTCLCEREFIPVLLKIRNNYRGVIYPLTFFLWVDSLACCSSLNLPLMSETMTFFFSGVSRPISRNGQHAHQTLLRSFFKHNLAITWCKQILVTYGCTAQMLHSPENTWCHTPCRSLIFFPTLTINWKSYQTWLAFVRYLRGEVCQNLTYYTVALKNSNALSIWLSVYTILTKHYLNCLKLIIC